MDDVKFYKPVLSEKQMRLVHKALYEAIGRRKTYRDMPEDERKRMRAEAAGMQRADNKILRSMARSFIGLDDESEDSVC
jgi:hypothetical protein